jgi:anthranilate synthase component 2
MKNILLIDNYDSFTYNLFQYLKEEGARVKVVLNDDNLLKQEVIEDAIVLSPGPGIPDEAGYLKEVIEREFKRKPILGVCLGHQAIAEVFGGKLCNTSLPVHGESSLMEHLGNSPLFSGLPKQIHVGRYHSWVVEKELPDELELTARLEDGTVMGIRHKQYPVEGVQFHPESILSPDGKKCIANFLKSI